jgi:hypothetical protein
MKRALAIAFGVFAFGVLVANIKVQPIQANTVGPVPCARPDCNTPAAQPAPTPCNRPNCG